MLTSIKMGETYIASSFSDILSFNCFVCQELCSEKNSISTAFKMFIKYLELDDSHLSSYFNNYNNASGREPVSVPLCDSCCLRVKAFWELYKDFETLRLSLDNCVQCLCDKMKQSSGGILTGNGKRMQRLREATVRKGLRKIQSTPRIKLDKIFTTNIDAVNISKTGITEEEATPNCQDFLDEDLLSYPLPYDLVSVEIKPDPDIDLDDNHLESEAEAVFELNINSNEERPCFTKIEPQVSKQKSSPLPYSTYSYRKPLSSFRKLIKQKRTIPLPALPPPPTPPLHAQQSETEAFQCDFCQNVSFKEDLNWVHMLRHHILELYSGTIPPGTTEVELQTASSNLVDKRKVYSSGTLGCPYCSKSFRQDQLLRDHLQENHFDKVLVALENPQDVSLEPLDIGHHSLNPNLGRLPFHSTKKDHQCPMCEKKYADQKGLSRHMKTHITAVERRKFFCPRANCNRVFMEKTSMKQHQILNHSFEYFKSYLSPGISEEMFENAVQQVVEGRIIYENDCTRSECSSCKKLFPSKRELKRHVMLIHVREVLAKLT